MDINQAKELLRRYQAGNCTPSERELIEKWYQQLVETGDWKWDEEEKDIMQKSLEHRIMDQLGDTSKKSKTNIFWLPRTKFWIAASVVLLVSTFGYLFIFNNTTKPAKIGKTLPGDIKAPLYNRAVITLANGQKVFLDSAANGALAVQGNIKLVKLAGGEIAYQNTAGELSRALEYNTLSNPRGSKVISIILADGSKVWLNAGSALTYPVAFIDNERKVSINGEAYFEVAHDDSKSFIVNNGSLNIQVLGTHFNVNTFKDDNQDLAVTLLEGSVKINDGKANTLLKPGQQARVNDDVKIISDVDLNTVMGWKNGYFVFENASLQSVLKQVARWYDVDVVYAGINEPREFAGEIQRDLSLTGVLKILENNNVHFKLEGKKLIVLSD